MIEHQHLLGEIDDKYVQGDELKAVAWKVDYNLININHNQQSLILLVPHSGKNLA